MEDAAATQCGATACFIRLRPAAAFPLQLELDKPTPDAAAEYENHPKYLTASADEIFSHWLKMREKCLRGRLVLEIHTHFSTLMRYFNAVTVTTTSFGALKKHSTCDCLHAVSFD